MLSLASQPGPTMAYGLEVSWSFLPKKWRGKCYFGQEIRTRRVQAFQGKNTLHLATQEQHFGKPAEPSWAGNLAATCGGLPGTQVCCPQRKLICLYTKACFPYPLMHSVVRCPCVAWMYMDRNSFHGRQQCGARNGTDAKLCVATPCSPLCNYPQSQLIKYGPTSSWLKWRVLQLHSIQLQTTGEGHSAAVSHFP